MTYKSRLEDQFSSTILQLKKWYEGEYIPYKNDPNSMVVLIGGTYRRSIGARLLRRLVEFWGQHWQWVIGTAIAIFGLVLVYALDR